MMLKKIVSGFFVAACMTGGAIAQPTYTVPVPQILPPSPEAWAFVKAGVGNVNMSTGAATASIPLYTIKLRDYSFPISLSYSTQGLKADEASSRVGYGWVLNATGMITRSVKGKPDEFAERLREPASFSGDAASLYNFCADGSSSTTGGDTQPDEFSFNVNGYSGKFVLDSNYVPRVTATSNVKIKMDMLVTPGSTSGSIDRIYLTTPDGVNYQFGDAYEVTTDYNLLAFSPYKLVTKTAFFLDRIELPQGETIVFDYLSVDTRSVTGITQTLQLSKFDGGTGDCIYCDTRNSYTTQEDKVEYSTRYLTGITTSDGVSIGLSYESRPDMSYDKRLTSLVVQGLKQYIFHYYDVAGSSSRITGRYFLTRLQDLMHIGDAPSSDSSYDHLFTYDSLSSVPLPITYDQDYLGFAGQSSSYFIPPALNSSGELDLSSREPLFEAAKMGTLTSITFPTGGKEEFLYEANTRKEITLRNTFTTLSVEGNGSSGLFPKYSTFFTLPRTQDVNISTFATDRDLGDGNTADSSHPTVITRIYEGGTLIASRSSLGYITDNSPVSLLTGHSYKLEIEIKDQYVRGYCIMTYDSSAVDIYDTANAEIPGVRVKQIRLTDPITLNTHSKYYTYSSLADLPWSTGGIGGNVVYKSSIITRYFCGQFGDLETSCILKIYSSSSTNEVYSLAANGSLIYYTTVIESDDPGFANGGTEYTFFPYDLGGTTETVLGDVGVPYQSLGQFPTLTGQVQETKVFDKDRQTVQLEENEYESSIALDHYVNSFYVRMRYVPWFTRSDRMDAFDVVKTHYADFWYRLKSKTVTSYANGLSQTQKTSYTYNGPENISPLATITTDSRGAELKTENKYPTDFPSDAVFGKMVRKNIILPVVQQSSYRSAVLLQQKKTSYRDWFGDSTVIMPDTVKVKESPSVSLHNALQFTRYNRAGSPQALRKVDDIGMVYLWDSLHALPVCEVKNAGFDQVAFAGFEDGTAYGNWTLSSGAVNTTYVFTGARAFTGTLTKTITTAGVYTVSLWTRSSATVNSSAGTLLRTVRSWKLYEWTLTNPSTVTVAGTYLDEVRLHPKSAVLTSYTYWPFVGITSMTDADNNVVYYEYDTDLRLLRIRDVDKNIIKQFAYKYQEFATSVAVWRSTGATRCKPCPANAAYITNMQQHEEKDYNPQSATYNTSRWLDDGLPGSCTITPDWQSFGSPYCQQMSGINTGYQVIPKKDMNPCSPTYNTTHDTTVYNISSCPIPCSGGNCSGPDKKCVSGICETGTRINLSTVYMKINNPNGGSPPQIWVWRCTYYYVWSDCSTSSNYTEDNISACTLNNNECGVQ